MKPLVAALLTGAALELAPVALADGSDDQFLSALAAAGIPAHDGIPGVIAHGHNVCDALGGECLRGRQPTSWLTTAMPRTRAIRSTSTCAPCRRSCGCRRRPSALDALARPTTTVVA